MGCFSKKPQKVEMHLGNFVIKNIHQELSKIAQSGHTARHFPRIKNPQLIFGSKNPDPFEINLLNLFRYCICLSWHCISVTRWLDYLFNI